MKYFLGIDGGGSKTRFALSDRSGAIISEYNGEGVPYRQIGADKVIETLKHGIAEVCEGVLHEDILGGCFGLPCYGENVADDEQAAQAIADALAPLRIRFENDVALAWAGSLAFQSGIVILAGTGSMALGRDIRGEIKRVGGWSEFFSDEGSGYWLGRRTLEIFSKQSDGRLPRGRLYDIVREHFSLGDDYEIINIIETKYMQSRRNIASLQELLYRSAEEGDAAAVNLYAEAAMEQAAMVKALRRRMELAPQSPVSYAGGLFKAGGLLLEPLKEGLADLDMEFMEPLLLPVDGAILFAAEMYERAGLPALREGLLRSRGGLNVGKE